MTLQQFVDNRPDGTYAILWHTSIGNAAGTHEVYETFDGCPEPFQGANGDLNRHDDWEWDGAGDFADNNANSIRMLKAWIVNEEGYQDLIRRGVLQLDEAR